VIHLDPDAFEDNLHLIDEMLNDEADRQEQPAGSGRQLLVNPSAPSRPTVRAEASAPQSGSFQSSCPPIQSSCPPLQSSCPPLQSSCPPLQSSQADNQWPPGGPAQYSSSYGHRYVPNPDYCHPDYIRQFRMEIPHLDHLADGLILATRITDLLKMESNSIKRQSADRGRSQEDKLLKNLDDLRISVIRIPAGEDNRVRNLHMARFIPSAVSTAHEQWLIARDIVDVGGYPPVGAYDMNCVGLDGHVTARGWIELQNPSSTALSAKQFTLANNTSRLAADKRISLAAGEDSFEVRESLREAASVAAFQTSIRAMREAARLSMPWNSSIPALEGFLISSHWMEKDIGSGQNAVRILSEFTDHVFSVNAGRWRAGKVFLDFTELGSIWTSWYTSRGGSIKEHNKQAQPSGASTSGQNSKKKDGQQQKQAKTAPPKQPRAGGPKAAGAADNICKRFNFNKCPNQATGVCRTSAGLVLRHVCNFLKPDNTRCEAAHMRLNH
jgi:hypothetical protein